MDSANRKRTWARTLNDIGARWAVSRSWNIWQIRYTMGAYSDIPEYDKWIRRRKMTRRVDDVGEDGALCWIGERRYDRVFLWLHGTCVST